MATTAQEKIINRLKSLNELEHVLVDVSGSNSGTLRVVHDRHHAPEFLFVWSSDHFIGYFIDGAGKQSQALVSLYTPLHAINFVSAYVILDQIRANQRSS